MRKFAALFVIAFIVTSFAAPSLKVFFIGDSISIHYHDYLAKFLAETFYYDRKKDDGGQKALLNLDDPAGANGGDSRMVLDYIRNLKRSDRLQTDFLVVNCGMHDIKRDAKTGVVQISIEQYGKNLDSIYSEVKSMRIKLIWINSTPVCDSIHNSKRLAFNRYNSDVVEYNSVAKRFFSGKRVPIIDLYTFSTSFGKEAFIDHVHYKPEYRKLQAAFIAGYLMNLKKK